MRKIRHNYPQDARSQYRIYEIYVLTCIHNFPVAVAVSLAFFFFFFCIFYELCCLGSFAATIHGAWHTVRACVQAPLSFPLPPRLLSNPLHLCVFCFSLVLFCGLHWANPETRRPYIMPHNNNNSNNKEVRVEEAALAMFTVGGKSRTSLGTTTTTTLQTTTTTTRIDSSRKCQTTSKSDTTLANKSTEKSHISLSYIDSFP